MFSQSDEQPPAKFGRVAKVITNFLGTGHTAVFDQDGQQINELQFKEASDEDGSRLERLRLYWCDEHTIWQHGSRGDAAAAFRRAFPDLF